MTVSSLTSRKNQVSDGILVSFVYDYLILDETHLKLYLDGDEDNPLSGFTVTGVGNNSGGTAEFTIAPAAGTLSLVRKVPLTQVFDYITGGKFPADTHERLADLLVMMVQELEDKMGRSLQLPVSSDVGDLTLPEPVADFLLQWNSTADGLNNIQLSELGSLVITTAFTESFLASPDSAAARAILETAGLNVANLFKNATPFIFEGVTDNAFETTLAIEDPTTDETITLPNKTGTLVLDSDSIGTSIVWNTSTIPNGYLEEDGAAISRTTYAALFAIIGTTFGVGDGSTTFNLPDKRGEFLRGFNNGAGNDPDAATRTDRGDGTTGDNIGTKQASISGGSEVTSINIATMAFNIGTRTVPRAGTSTRVTTGGDLGNVPHGITLTTALFGAETRPRNINVIYCIKY